MAKKISLSVVSHGHKRYIEKLFKDLAALERSDFMVILTLNLPEELPFDSNALPFPVEIIKNSTPKGFAENHNSAFEKCATDYFVILNPDIKFIDDPFDNLLSIIEKNPSAIVAPSVVNIAGVDEDSARYFPTPFLIIQKILAKIFKLKLTVVKVPEDQNYLLPDWVAGMFILVSHKNYAKLGGLSERYFMYYEDVDFSARARLLGSPVLVSKKAKVIHDAQRDSHRKFKYMLWHARSMMTFFISEAFLKIYFLRYNINNKYQ